MSRPRARFDSSDPDAPIRIELCGTVLHLTVAEGHALREELWGVLLQADPIPDTLRPEEPATTPGTPEARRRSSDRLAAVQLPEPGLDQRVAAELAEGKTK